MSSSDKRWFLYGLAARFFKALVLIAFLSSAVAPSICIHRQASNKRCELLAGLASHFSFMLPQPLLHGHLLILHVSKHLGG